MRFDRDHQLIGGDQDVDRQHVQRRRRVDQDVIPVGKVAALQSMLELAFPLEDVEQLELGGGEVGVRRNEGNPRDRGWHGE